MTNGFRQQAVNVTDDIFFNYMTSKRFYEKSTIYKIINKRNSSDTFSSLYTHKNITKNKP